MKRLTMVLTTVFLMALVAVPASAGSVHRDVPATPNPKAYYLFYMHGRWLEEHRLTDRNRRYGLYQYQPILGALANRGFAVIAEIRPKGTGVADYARKVMGQIERLIAAGVPPSHIVVTGFSKGGQMALQVGALNTHPEVSFVIMAGCAKSQKPFALTGRFLSLIDFKDRVAGPCRSAFETMSEVELKVGRGHGTFYKPLHEWTGEVAKWVGR